MNKIDSNHQITRQRHLLYLKMTKENWRFEILCACTSGSDGSAPDMTGGSEGITCIFKGVNRR